MIMKKKDMANNQNRKEKNITFIKNFIKSNYFPFVLLFVLLCFSGRLSTAAVNSFG